MGTSILPALNSIKLKGKQKTALEGHHQPSQNEEFRAKAAFVSFCDRPINTQGNSRDLQAQKQMFLIISWPITPSFCCVTLNKNVTIVPV